MAVDAGECGVDLMRKSIPPTYSDFLLTIGSE